MKVCDNCQRINPDDVEECLGCGGKEFETLHFISEANSIEPYLREHLGEKNDNRDRNQVP